MKRITIILAALTLPLFAIGASAAQTKVFAKYENVRQALLKGSFADVQSSARDLTDAARAEKQNRIADRASALANVANLKAARDSFAMLSDEVIRFRDGQSGERPVVVYCSMHKASWLQAKGAITNPYTDDASMRSCGQIRGDEAPSAPSRGHHH